MGPFGWLVWGSFGSQALLMKYCSPLMEHGAFWMEQWIIGWLRLEGSLKLEVSFAEEPNKRDDILQKRLIILRSLPIEATSYCAP